MKEGDDLYDLPHLSQMKSSHTLSIVGAIVLAAVLWMLFGTRYGIRKTDNRVAYPPVQHQPGSPLVKNLKTNQGRSPNLESDDSSKSSKKKIYELPVAQQEAVTVVAINGDLTLSWQIIKALSLTPPEREAVTEKINKFSTALTRWETANASIIEGTNILRIPPSGQLAKYETTTLESAVLETLGRERGNFFLMKARTAIKIISGNEGESTKLVRVSFNRDDSGQLVPDSPYLAEIKVINNEAQIRYLDWKDPGTFSSDSISNLSRTLTFKEIPSEYAHLIESPPD